MLADKNQTDTGTIPHRTHLLMVDTTFDAKTAVNQLSIIARDDFRKDQNFPSSTRQKLQQSISVGSKSSEKSRRDQIILFMD